jgi:DNA-binding MarR family transcriptional regulator
MGNLDRPDDTVQSDTLPALTSPSRRSAVPRRRAEPEATAVIDLDRYVPGVLTWISKKLSGGAAQHYLNLFDVGVETWRCLVLLAIEGSISAQKVSRIIGMDKGSVSRCFKRMQAKALITMRLDSGDGRLRIATLTKKGRALHDQIMGIALERERAFLAVLSEAERAALLGLLKRLHENLPAVEDATQAYVARQFPKTAPRRKVRVTKDEGG